MKIREIGNEVALGTLCPGAVFRHGGKYYLVGRTEIAGVPAVDLDSGEIRGWSPNIKVWPVKGEFVVGVDDTGSRAQ
jgi:hypothetical protein